MSLSEKAEFVGCVFSEKGIAAFMIREKAYIPASPNSDLMFIVVKKFRLQAGSLTRFSQWQS